MCDELDTISLEELREVSGGGDVDRSLQGQWIDKRLENMRKHGMLNVDRGSRGLATPNGNFGPNVIPIR